MSGTVAETLSEDWLPPDVSAPEVPVVLPPSEELSSEEDSSLSGLVTITRTVPADTSK